MCCFASRRTPALIVTGSSVLIIVTGIVMLAMAIYFETNPSIWSLEMEETIDAIRNGFRQGVFTVVLIASLIAIGVGVGGALCTVKACSNCCAAVAFGIILFFVWILYLVAGSLITGIANLGWEASGTACDGEQTNPVIAPLSLAIVGLSDTVNLVLNTHMCGSVCKCDDAIKTPYLAMSEEDLNLKYRTLGANANNLVCGPDRDSACYEFAWTTEADDMTATFVECVAKVNEQTSEENDGWSMAAKFQGFFETKYDCSGICSVPLFYANRPVSDGIPNKTCLNGLQTEIQGSSLYLGVTAIVIGLLMFITWIFQYCLWKNYDK